MTTEHDDLAQRVEDLREFEREYRLRLRLHLEDCLATVSSGENGLPLWAAARRLGEAPGADLRAALADLSEDQRQRILSALLLIPVPEATA